jgi:hypothetical protein
VKFEDTPEQKALSPEQRQIKNEALFFFQRFSAINFYYSQVSRVIGPGFTPSFYRFKVLPMDGSKLNRVYEVEEHVGEIFLEAASKMHIESVSKLNRKPI